MKKVLEIISKSLGFETTEKILFKGKSEYRLLTVTENRKNNTRIMYASNKKFVAGIDLKTGIPLYSPYFIADLFMPNPNSILFLGGGPCAVPTYVWANYNPKLIDVVERDSLTIKLAKKYFNLPENNNYRIFLEDAKIFIKKQMRKYDIIYFDLGLTRKRSLERNDLYELCTLKGINLLSDHLNKKGVLVYIVIARLENSDLRFLKQCLVALKKTFPAVHILSDHKNKPHKLQSVIFIATKSKSDLKKQYKRLLISPYRMHEKTIYEQLMAKYHDSEGSFSSVKSLVG
jgi:spermidine synthase